MVAWLHHGESCTTHHTAPHRQQPHGRKPPTQDTQATTADVLATESPAHAFLRRRLLLLLLHARQDVPTQLQLLRPLRLGLGLGVLRDAVVLGDEQVARRDLAPV